MRESFIYPPNDHENEKASNSYLMSMLAFMVGLPFPVINLVATLIFYLGNRKGTFFVRWHCTQAFVSQLTVLAINSVAFTWTMRIIFGDLIITNAYIAYILTVIFFNVVEIIATIYAAQQVRRGRHVKLWFFGTVTALICRK